MAVYLRAPKSSGLCRLCRCRPAVVEAYTHFGAEDDGLPRRDALRLCEGCRDGLAALLQAPNPKPSEWEGRLAAAGRYWRLEVQNGGADPGFRVIAKASADGLLVHVAGNGLLAAVEKAISDLTALDTRRRCLEKK